MKNYEAEKLKKIIQQKEHAMKLQVEETDRLRKENLTLRGALTQCHRDAFNEAIREAALSATVKYGFVSTGDYSGHNEYKVDINSILKLLKP